MTRDQGPSPIDGRVESGAHDEDRNAGAQAVDIDAGGAQHGGSDVVRSRLVALVDGDIEIDRLVHELVTVGRGLGVAGLNRTSAALRSCLNFWRNYGHNSRCRGKTITRGCSPQCGRCLRASDDNLAAEPFRMIRRKSGHSGSSNRSDFPTRCPTVAPIPIAPAKHALIY